MSRTVPTLVSVRFDTVWFALPGVLSVGLGLAIGSMAPSDASGTLAIWILGVVLVDVAHVYASLYRTYLDPVARRLHRPRLVWAPILCGWVGFLVHLESPRLFWTVLAYVAIFHFIKQHVGFAMLYARAGGEDRAARRWAEIAIWAGTLGPVIHWHANLPRNFVWFIEGDMVAGLPRWVGVCAMLVTAAVMLGFAGSRVVRRGRSSNPFLVAMVVLPALNWTLGIVVFDDDRVFTVTNVLLHGVPYMALVWVTGGRQRTRGLIRRAHTLPLLAVYYGSLVVFAFGEEGLWDRLVWHDHPGLFGPSSTLDAHPVVVSVIIALLTVPQATHYLLDRWIWRVGPSNPALGVQLGFEPRGQSPHESPP